MTVFAIDYQHLFNKTVIEFMDGVIDKLILHEFLLLILGVWLFFLTTIWIADKIYTKKGK